MDKLTKDFLLLKTIVSAKDSFAEKVDLSAVERLIMKELPDALSDNAPPNFPQLYFDFTQEYERFKNFILYDELIGKNVVALGGGFSSGKSTFLNSLLDHKILPVSINPSTSVPAYLVHGDHISVYGINTFKSRVSMDLEQVPAISHGFGKIDENDSEATLGHILESIFISSPYQCFKNIAMLDTPGYSKAESSDYSAKTDEKIAHAQLNSANYILWFVQADAGTITEEDIAFLSTINKDIPRLIIVNKADKVLPEDLAVIVKKIKDVLRFKAVPFVDVLTYSRKKDFADDREKIISILDQWDNEVYESRFAYNFKVLFTNCKEFYDHRIDEEGQRLNRLNKAVTLATDDTVSECLTSLVSDIKRSITDLKDRREHLKALQNEFFSEIKRIGDIVNIAMPEPSEIDLIRDKTLDPKTILDEYCEKHGVKRNNDLQRMLSERFENIHSVFNSLDGNSGFDKELFGAIADGLNISSDRVQFNHLPDNSADYVAIVSEKTNKLKVANGGVKL